MEDLLGKQRSRLRIIGISSGVRAESYECFSCPSLWPFLSPRTLLMLLRIHQNLAVLHPLDVQIWPSSLGLWVGRTYFHRMLRRVCSSQRPGAFQGKGLGREQRTAYAKALRLEGACTQQEERNHVTEQSQQ